MNKKIVISAIIGAVALSILGATILIKNKPNSPVINDEAVYNQIPTASVVSTVKLTCYDAVNKILEADGFTYLEKMKWGRGLNNLFVIDLATLQFQMADSINTQAVPLDWYKSQSYDKYVKTVYHHTGNKVVIMDLVGGSTDSISTIDATKLSDVNSGYHELPEWMSYYVSKFAEVGCPIEKMNEAKLYEYKTKESKITESAVVSVFDRKSTDGTLRYFMDAHQSGKIEDNLRYKEINSYAEFIKLKEAGGFESYYLFNILNNNSIKTFASDSSGLQASILKEFVKDVVFTQTPTAEYANENKVDTLGVYFINVDNPNGNFKSMYKAPVKGVGYSTTLVDFGQDLRNFNMPYAGTSFGATKDASTGYEFNPFSVSTLTTGLGEYIKFIQNVNPDVMFSDDFIRNYSRPFALEWQKKMGLKTLFDKKFGLTDDSIKYIN